MAYELTAAASSTGNPYVIVGAAIIDTIRAAARQTTTQTGTGLQQNQLSAENFAGYVGNAIQQMQGGNAPSGSADRASSVFTDALSKRGAGTYSLITAPTYTTDKSSQTTKRSIVCTTLMELGELHPVVYFAGIPHWEAKNQRMINGYHRWGYTVADWCRKYKTIRKIAGYIARSRYLYVLFDQRNIVGVLTVKVGEPLCYALGRK